MLLQNLGFFKCMAAKKFLASREGAAEGVLGKEIFCPRAVGFSCPPPAAAGNSQAKFRFLDLWIKFGKIISKV